MRVELCVHHGRDDRRVFSCLPRTAVKRSAFADLGEKRGLLRFTNHDLRRMAITRRASQGRTTSEVMAMAGHSSITVTAKHYTNRRSIEAWRSVETPFAEVTLRGYDWTPEGGICPQVAPKTPDAVEAPGCMCDVTPSHYRT